MPFPPLMNSAAAKLCRQAITDRSTTGVAQSMIGGATILEFAPDKIGTIEAGIALARICLGAAGRVNVGETIDGESGAGPLIHVEIDQPLAACMGCQYAGWPLSVGKYFAMASGPIRLLRGKEKVLTEYSLSQTDAAAVVVLETAKSPDESVVGAICDDANVPAEQLLICVARTSSIPGSLQVVARSVETAMHKLHELHFDLTTITRGVGSAPLPPKTDDDMVALGWTNDSVLYGATVELTVDTDDELLKGIVDKTPSCSSKEFGRPFIELFKHYEYDFYKIDPMLFSPAKIVFHNSRTGNSFSAGEIRSDILKRSFA